MWNNKTRIKDINHLAFTIEALLNDEEVKSEWQLIGIYASCDSQI